MTKVRHEGLSGFAILVCILGGPFLVVGAFTSPIRVVVSPQGEIASPIFVMKEFAQGPEFWRNQVEMARQELADLAREAQSRLDATKEFEAQLRMVDKAMADLYKTSPEFRPSSAMEQASALRLEADRIELADKLRNLEAERLKRIAELNAIIELSTKRAHLR